jgi:hypothetical protein
MRLLALIIGALVLSCSLIADPIPPNVKLTLDPLSGTLSGSPGDVVGWGFTLATDSDYILIDSFNFLESTLVGTFTAFAPLFAAASSSSPLTAPFDPLAGAGVGSYLIGAFPKGSSSTGEILVTYDVFDSDPTIRPANDLFSGLQVSAPAEVDVVGGAAVVPEPATYPVLFLFAAWILLKRRLRQRLSSH